MSVGRSADDLRFCFDLLIQNLPKHKSQYYEI